jgi:hypothetical protein
MPLEFALRPRIKLREGFAPPRRSRWRVPKLALPIAAYWLTAGGITYALIHAHGQPAAPAPVVLAPQSDEPWWPGPAARAPSTGLEAAPITPAPAAVAPPALEPSPTNEDAPVANEPADVPSVTTPALGHDEPEKSRALPTARDGEPSDDAVASAKQETPALDSLPITPVEPPARGVVPLLGATPPDAPVAVANALPSCEAAVAAANQEVDLTQRDHTPDLSREVIASVLDNGVWIARCDIPMTTAIDLCVAIRSGKVIGVSVLSRPVNAAINACVKRRAASLSFPYSARVDLAKTHF